MEEQEHTHSSDTKKRAALNAITANLDYASVDAGELGADTLVAAIDMARRVASAYIDMWEQSESAEPDPEHG